MMSHHAAGGKTRRPYRVLFFAPVATYKGGAERSLMDLISNPSVEPIVLVPAEGPIADELRRRGIQFHILDLGAIQDIRRPLKLADGVRTSLALLSRGRLLRNLCRRERIEIVHSNGLKAHAIACVARRLGGPPTVVHIRDIPITTLENFFWILLSIVADAVVLVSRACWSSPQLPRKVSVIHNGISQITTGKVGHRKREKSDMVIGFVGRLHPSKGLHVLLTWIKSANEAGLRLRLIVRGAFSADSPDYENEIYGLVRQLSLEKVVSFEGFLIDPRSVYAGLDFVCVPSQVPDPLPRAVMEAMALGIPVIAFPTGGIPEMIDHGKDGVFVRSDIEFIAAIKAFLEDWNKAEAMIVRAKKKIAAEFSLDVLHERTASLYSKLLSPMATRSRTNI